MELITFLRNNKTTGINNSYTHTSIPGKGFPGGSFCISTEKLTI